VLVDADPNRADASVLCGLDATYTVADVLGERCDIDEVLTPGPGGLQVLPGGWPCEDHSDAFATAPARLLSAVRHLGAGTQFVVFDLGSGAHRVLRDVGRAVDSLLVVSSPDPLSVIDAYAAIKLLVADRAAPVHSIINLAAGAPQAAETQRRLSATCRRFLGRDLIAAGYVPLDERVAAAGKRRQAFVLDEPRSEASACLAWLAEFIAAGRKNSLNPARANNR
jgi:flagellar biosynthesis protein FlhG